MKYATRMRVEKGKSVVQFAENNIPIPEPPTKIPNNDITTPDVTEIDNEFKLPPINDVPVIVQPSNELRRSTRIKNQWRGIGMISVDYDGDNLE